MTLTTIPLPYGLRDVKIRPMAPGTETAGTAVDLPNSRTFSFAEAEDFEELRGDDGLRAIHGKGPIVNWQLEGGGISFEAAKAMFGGTITETGVTPNQVKTFRKLGLDVRPYFQVEGQSISDSGGDVHCLVYKARATGDMSGEFADGSFFLMGAQGQGLPRLSDDRLYDFIQNETATPITPTDEVQVVTISGGPTGGTFALTFSAQTTTGIAYNASAATVQTALEALSNIAPGDVVVTGSAGGPYTVTFAGTLADADQPQMTINTALLTGGSASGAVTTTQAGGE